MDLSILYNNVQFPNPLVLASGFLQKVERGGVGARYTKCGWSPFEGLDFYVWPVKTVVGGRVVVV